MTFVILSKTFLRRAKPTRSGVLYMHVDMMLEMASDMLLLVADEVARNGAFWKYFGQRSSECPFAFTSLSCE